MEKVFNTTMFSNLPVRKEYLEAVLGKLPKGKEFVLREVVSKCGLSRTQTNCALNHLIKNKRIKISERDGKKFYSMLA